MAIIDLTGTTWTFNDTVDFSLIQTSTRFNIVFTTLSTVFADVSSIYISQNTISYYSPSFEADVQVYGGSWIEEELKTITITGGTDSTNATLISWIEANATQYIEPHDIIISYNGNTITIDDSGTEVLDTKGHWLPDDITVQYTKSGGTPTLQSKTVTPSGSELVVTPDAGFDGLSDVTVNPIMLKMGVLLPAAELVKSYTYDKLIVEDEGITLPAYSTSSQTLKASANLTPTVPLTFNSYSYYVLIRCLTTPIYNTSTIVKGRNEYHLITSLCEIVEIPPSTFVTSSGKYYTTRNTTIISTTSYPKLFYWSSATSPSLYSGSYGCYQTITAPSLSSSSSATPNLTLKSPVMYIRGNATYFPESVWNTTTDVRYQYIIEVYRVPKNTYNLNGWGIYQQASHIIDCAYGTLT